MSLNPQDTIAALASASGPASRGVIRVSGPDVKKSLDSFFTPDDPVTWSQPALPHCHAGRLEVSQFDRPLPVDVYLWPGRRSYTGQPMAELYLPGSPPLLEAVLSELHRRSVRPARRGEFTLRAFLAGRIDLLQAEAVLGVVDAGDEQQLEQALGQLAGGISGRMADVRDDLVNLLADLEAGLDFVDEDIEFVPAEEVVQRIEAAADFLNRLLEQAAGRMQSTPRARVVLAGLPNAGKSTLFNALAGRDEALVSHARGTTRDYLSCPLNWSMSSIELIDTAGWQMTSDNVMEHAQLLRSQQIDRADVVIWCTAADLDAAASRLDHELRSQITLSGRVLVTVCTKSDLAATGCDASTALDAGDLAVSGRTGRGIDDLIEAVAKMLTESNSPNRELLASTASRCRDSLLRAADALQNARQAAANAAGDEIVVIEIRETLEHLGRILGTVYTDDILDRIFSRFCIGK